MPDAQTHSIMHSAPAKNSFFIFFSSFRNEMVFYFIFPFPEGGKPCKEFEKSVSREKASAASRR